MIECALAQCRNTGTLCYDIMKSRQKELCRDIENPIATEASIGLEN